MTILKGNGKNATALKERIGSNAKKVQTSFSYIFVLLTT
jgi:hypothetical protein